MIAVISIRSFLVYARPGCREALAAALEEEPGCEVYPSSNADVLVLVTEHISTSDEAAFDARLAERDDVEGVALVSGFQHNEREP